MRNYCWLTFAFLVMNISTAVFAASIPAIDPQKVFHESGVDYVGVSPGGSKLVVLRRDGDETSMEIRTVSNNKTIAQYKVGDRSEKNYLLDFSWVDDRYIAMETSKSVLGIGDLEDSKSARRLLIYDTSNQSAKPKVVSTQGGFAHSLPTEAGKFLFERASNVSNIYKIDVSMLAEEGAVRSKLDLVDGGQFTQKNVVANVEAYAMRWFINRVGVAEAVLTMNSKKVMELQEIGEDKKYQVIASWDLDERAKIARAIERKKAKRDKSNSSSSATVEEQEKFYMPYMKAVEPSTYYVFDTDEEPRSTIYLENYKTKERTKLYDAGGLKILSLILSEKNEFLGVRVIANDRVEFRYSDGDVVDLASTQNRRVVSRSFDGNVQAVFTGSFNEPGAFFLSKSKDGPLQHLAFHNEALQKSLPGKQSYDSIDVGGVKVSYLLNVPDSKKSQYPLIVMPHGGPFSVFDNPYYDAEVQFWVAHDYAVLRVNFRGSGGRGKEYEDLGKRQYGLAMLDDIMLATKAVSATPSIDAKKICVFGMSYGGYAAMMLTLKYPEIYRCGVSFAGISDLNLFLNDHVANREQKKWASEYIGNPVTNYDDLKQQSPLYQMEKLQVPWLVMQGKDDTVVDPEHFYRVQMANKRLNKAIEFKLFENQGHSFESGANDLKINQTAFEFVHSRLNKL